MLQRLKELRKSLGLNQSNFAKYIGITQTAYSMIENGINPLSDKHIKVICSSFDVSENWLKTGEGNMFIHSSGQKELTNIFDKLTEESQKYLLLVAKGLLKLQKTFIVSKN